MNATRNFISQILKNSLVMVGVFLFLSTAGQDINTSFDDWDADRDERIYENEFRQGLYDDYQKRNGTTDLSYNEDQFYESAYDWWDANRDQRLDETEWNLGYENSYGEYLDQDFDAYDTNSDGYLHNEEYYSSFNESEYYSSWDSNNDDLFDLDEYSTGTFDLLDENKDKYIDENEFGEFNLD